MSFKDSIIPLELASVGSNTLNGVTYTAIDTSGMEGPAFFIRLQNDTDQDVFISYDGTTDHEFLLLGATLEVSFQNNAQPNNYRAVFKKGTVIYAKGVAGTGNVVLSGFYQN